MRGAKQDLYRRKAVKKVRALQEMLSRCDDRAMMQLAWAVNILQSPYGARVNRFLNYPVGAATSDTGSEFAVRKWDIETILSLLFTTHKWGPRAGERQVRYRMDQFGTMAEAVNLLRDAENYQAGEYLTDGNLMLEMSRIAHRQFGWQRGFATTERLYRYAYVYGQGACTDYFAAQNGMSIADFLKAGFYLHTQLHHAPWAKPVPIDRLDIDIALIERALPLLSTDITGIRRETSELFGKLQGRALQRIAYLPNALRRYPVIYDKRIGGYISPLPQLIMFRITAGLYYDMVGGPKQLGTEANARFEAYVRNLIEAYLPRFKALPSHVYGPKKARIDSPDVLVQDGDAIIAVIECKATKLTFDAQFADDPMEAAKGAYSQLIKGIAQLWRFFSHVRRGIYDGPQVSSDAHAVLLTLDTWMQMSGLQRDQAIAAARDLIKDEPEVAVEDQRPVVFCSMQDLADVMIVSDEEQMLLALGSTKLEKYEGWDFREVRRDAAGPEKRKAFPFDIGELLPWWKLFGKGEVAADVT